VAVITLFLSAYVEKNPVVVAEGYDDYNSWINFIDGTCRRTQLITTLTAGED
jgi:hypothetical protein